MGHRAMGRVVLGSGRARRSILPVGVSGKVSRNTKAFGTIYSGKRAVRPALISFTVSVIPLCRHDVGHEVGFVSRSPPDG